MTYITNAPWTKLTYKTIGLAMEVHNELGAWSSRVRLSQRDGRQAEGG